jgi:hypothetical protein
MEAEEIHNVLKHQPFEPVRIHVSDGASYEITHLDQLMVGRRSSYVGLGGNGDRPFPRIAIVANVHVMRIEPITRRKRKAK